MGVNGAAEIEIAGCDDRVRPLFDELDGGANGDGIRLAIC
jgi:hypothetical protein